MSILYPNTQTNPVKKSDELLRREEETRVRLKKDLPAMQWVMGFLERQIEKLGDIDSVKLDINHPENIAIQIGTMRQTKNILLSIKQEMEVRMKQIKD